MNPSEKFLELPCLPASVTLARHFVRDALEEWNLSRLVEDAQLATSELVANAVRHARTALDLTVRAADSVVVSIRDGDPQLRRPVAREDDALAESGRGLHIVAAVSSDWGITTATGGKIVWFSLDLPDEATSDADVVTMAAHRSRWATGAERRPDPSDLDGLSVSSRWWTAV